MSLTVKQFDDRKAEAELKKCPKIVRDYVKLLKEGSERWKAITHKAIRKMREMSAEQIPSGKVASEGFKKFSLYDETPNSITSDSTQAKLPAESRNNQEGGESAKK